MLPHCILEFILNMSEEKTYCCLLENNKKYIS